MTRALLILALTAAPAMGETVTLSHDTTITLRPSAEPGALAEVHFDNRNVNDARDNGDYSLTMDGLNIGVGFLWNAEGSADRITVTPPDGVLCRPSSCALTLPEDQSGRMFLFEWVGG